jgi:hypothetical protein
MQEEKKIVLCFFGVISRSIKHTFETIKKNIIDVINDKYIVSIYVFNLNTKNTKVDGIILDQKDISIIPYNIYEEYDQDNLDKEIEEKFKKGKDASSLFLRYRENEAQNCFRQMYSEYRVGTFLEKNLNKYDIAIVCGPDFYIANKIDINDIENSFTNNNFYTTKINDAHGYTNGFYIGKPSVLIKPLKRFLDLDKFLPLPSNKDYEYILAKSVIDNNITRNITQLVFFKFRANGKIFWTKNINYLSDVNKKIVLESFANYLKKKF